MVKIKDSLYVLEGPGEEYVFISTATRRIKKFKVDRLAKSVIESICSEISKPDLLKKLSKDYAKKDISLCLSALENEGLIQTDKQEYPKGRHYKQLLFLDELTNSKDETIKIHRKIQKSKIAVFGVGGIGTWIVNGLYQIGIGEIRITDPDLVEESNLNRQLFFDSKDIGEYKTEVISKKLNDANIFAFKKSVSPLEDLEEIIDGCNFLVNCADQPSVVETTRIIHKYASEKNIPYCVSGGYNLHLGMVGPIIIPGETKKFEDLVEYQERTSPLKGLKMIKDIQQSGNLGPIAGAIANIQTMEIFKYLSGLGVQNTNRFAEIDFMNFGIEWKEF